MIDTEPMENLLTAPSQRTLSDYVADRLRQAILAGQFRPNQRLVENQLATVMNTSRGPIRDALKILENEGLVIRQTHRVASVAPVNAEDMHEIYTLREVLEALAIRFIVKRATSEQIGELDKIVRAMEVMAQQDYGQMEATDLDIQFHHTLCKISGHKRVLNAWESLSGQVRIVVLKHRLEHPTDLRDRSVPWHASIVEALSRRDAEKAIELMHVHMAASMEWVDQVIKRYEEKQEPPA
ncbi:MAG: GntR family transcriptional regulator [Chloroflexi bacterium]|nr:GntR family transcriptional regulator [Chloroflexota bacterium]